MTGLLSITNTQNIYAASTGHSEGNELTGREIQFVTFKSTTGSYQRYKNKAQQMNIVEDQVNTANVWILRFVGTLEGTNLSEGCP